MTTFAGDARWSGDLRVMFDPQIFCHQRFGGVSRYFSSMTLELHRMEGVAPLVAAPFHFNEYLDQLPAALVLGRRVRWLEGKTFLAYGLSALPAAIAARRLKPHVLHKTYYFPTMAPAGSRSVLTIYDLIHERYPEYFGRNPLTARLKSASIAIADHLICISESTRRDLLTFYDVEPERVSVIHLGFDPLANLLTRESARDIRVRMFGADTPYLLYVGSRVGYKNFLGLLEAYASSAWLRTNFLLVCFGGGEFTRAERSAIAKVKTADRVRYRGGSDVELAAAYAAASLFVCPSLCEGFGIPLLEAMSLDCPVACSDSSSLPEVAGDAAALFDPADRDSIRATLEGILNSTANAAKLKQRGRIRSSEFSWRACAERTLGIYRRACAGEISARSD